MHAGVVGDNADEYIWLHIQASLHFTMLQSAFQNMPADSVREVFRISGYTKDTTVRRSSPMITSFCTCSAAHKPRCLRKYRI